MRSPTIILATLAAAASVIGHGVILTPTPRKTGAKQLEVCGSAVTAQLKSDTAGPIENSVAKIDANWTAACNLYLCRGYQYEDNKSNVKAYRPGDVQVIHIDLIAGHKPGWANVSVVDLATNKVIGTPLKSWSVWPDDVPGGGDDVDFNVTIPDALTSACNVGGKCAIQWYWWSNSNSQTYESCLDFYVTT